MLALSLLGCVPPVPPTHPPQRPVIGITGTSGAIVDAVRSAGGDPRLLDPGDDPQALLSTLDGLVLGPGADIDPSRYDQPPHSTIVRIGPAREASDLALAGLALAHDLPVLGICLGAQELVVAAGGQLIQDVPSQVPAPLDHRAPHEVRWEGGGTLARSHEGPSLVVSNHHQAADGLPPGLAVAARSPDGVIEAFDAPDRTLAWGVQFHPEEDEAHAHLWTALVAAAASDAPRAGPWPDPGPRPLPTCGVVRTPFDEPDREQLQTLRARVGSGFGAHRSSYVRGHKHAGVDLDTTPGEAVLAICPGEVVDVHLAFPHTTVVVAHRMADGSLRHSSYKHVTELQVRPGDRVHAQTRIGRVFDAAEQQRAPWRTNHLHLEIRTRIDDGGSASWTSMDLEQLGRYALDPEGFFEAHLQHTTPAQPDTPPPGSSAVAP